LKFIFFDIAPPQKTRQEKIAREAGRKPPPDNDGTGTENRMPEPKSRAETALNRCIPPNSGGNPRQR
jgi:hypothetical protein